MNRNHEILRAAWCCLAITALGISSVSAAERVPNVVLIYADDLGYGDLGCYGATKLRTPNIDRLAAEGRRFTDAHSASAVCTPSRYGLLTGEYPVRAEGGKGTWGPLSTNSGLIIDTNTLTIGKVFKSRGYATACLGKWHLGFKQNQNDWQVPLRPGPQDVGFDYYFGVPLVNSSSPYVYVENDSIVGYDPNDPLVYGGKPVSPTPMFPEEASRKSPNRFGGALEAHKIYDDEKTGTLLTEKAVRWITEKKDKPFFLYFPTPNIHHPFTPAPRFKGTSQCGLYGDFVHELDWMVGEILQCLDENGLSDNTLVIFTSDNGGMLNRAGRDAIKAGHKINGDLLGFKFGVWEGGHRIPFIARWPGEIKAGTESEQLISQIDLLATFMALTGQDPGALEGKDSVNMLPALLEESEKPLRTELLLAPRQPRNLAVRKGKWMYIAARGSGGFTGSKPSDHAWGGPPAAQFAGSINSDIENGRLKKDAPPAQLYDLECDLAQTANVYRENPQVVKEMEALLDAWRPRQETEENESAPDRKARQRKESNERVSSTPRPSPAAPVSSVSPSSSSEPRVGATKPNFVVIFTDDQGYGDLSCFGGQHVNTPRIDRMAAEGSRLTSFYVAAPVCTPSRAALLTGCYPKRIDMATGSNLGVLLAADEKGLNPDEITIAEVLKSVGYKTGIFGKWHLGDQPEFLPTKQGFDEFFGIPYSHDIHPFHPRQNHYKFPPLPLLENEQVIEMETDADYLTKRITERAVSFIENNKDEPFFLYIPHPIPHAPLHVSPPFMESVPDDIMATLNSEDGNIDYNTRHKLFRQAISEIDWSVGKILDTLKANGLDENTFVLFTSDNGPPKNSIHASPGPLRGNKGTTWEGGMREPTVVRWPGKIPAGQSNDELMTTMDLLPTFAKLAGAAVPADRVIDGEDIWPTLIGKTQTPHEAFFYHRGNQLQAVRSGRWKLHMNKGRPAQLYNLEDDIGETTNVIQSNPEVVQRLERHLQMFAKDIADNSRSASFIEDPKPLSIGSAGSPAVTPSPASAQSNRNATRSHGKKPNFVVIFADDLGFGDISCYNPAGVETPHLDTLATEGFRSTDFFVPANVCSPSRASLLTGRYPMRCGMPVARHESEPKYKSYGLATEEITIPELLGPAGYRSLMVGKWHLGMEVEGSHPLDAGFDEYLGIPSNYAKYRGPNYNTLYRGKSIEERNVPCEELTQRYTDEVVEFINRQKDGPFFIYVSHHIVHSPLLSSEDFVGTSKRGKYGDFIKELDHSTGRIMQAIRDAGLDNNSLVVFTSDNGPTRDGSTGGLNGGKYCTMEGGHRVPGIFRWMGKIPPNQTSDTTLSSMDLLPLFCQLADVEQPSDRKIDGKGILSILLGQETTTPHQFLYYYNGTNLQAVREGNWKLHLPRTVSDQPFWSKKPQHKWKGFVTLEQHRLFNLKSDVGERQDVADRYPEVVARLQQQAKAIRSELGDTRIAGTDQREINLEDPQER